MRGAFVERRSLSLHRHRTPPARPPCGGDADGPGILHRVGPPDTCGGRGAIQPDVVSQRLHLASRQCHGRGGVRPLRDARAGGPHPRRTVRRQPVRRSVPHAGALLRLSPPARRGADVVPGCVLAAGLVGRGRVHAAPGDARSLDRRRRAPDHDSQRHAAGVPAPRCGSRDFASARGRSTSRSSGSRGDLGVQVERNDAKAEILVVK